MRDCATTLAAEMTTSEHNLLISLLRSQQAPSHCLEIGTAAGGTLCAMMGAFEPTRRPKFVVVDPLEYFPNQLETVRRNLADHQLDSSEVDFRKATSAMAFPQAAQRGNQFDFILVDGCHRIESVMLDIKWTRLLKVGGVVCFHDYAPKFPGVMLCVDRLLKRHPNYERVAQADSLIAIQKHHISPVVEIDFSDRAFATAWAIRHRASRQFSRWQRATAAVAAKCRNVLETWFYASREWN